MQQNDYGMSPRTREDPVYSRVQTLRIDRGMSRAELAVALGVHYQTIGYIERGEYAPSLAVALRLATLFGLPVDAIFSLDPFPPLTSDQLDRHSWSIP